MIAKKKRILIMSLSITLAVIILLGITYGIIYSATDLLKSNKEMFYKYITKNQLANIIEVNWMKRYEEKNNSTPYQNKGKITFKQESSDEENSLNDELLSNIIIEIEGKADLAQNLQDQTVKLNYKNNEILRLDYLRTNDIYGVKINDVIDKYAAIENANLKDFLKRMGYADYEDIPNKIELLSFSEILQLIDNNKEKVKQELIKIIDSEIGPSDYKKIQKVEMKVDETSYITNAYYIQLTDVQISNIQRKLLEFARDDDEILDAIILLTKGKAKEDEDVYEMKEKIDESIANLKRKEATNEILVTISVYVEKSNLIAIELNYNDNDIIISTLKQNEVLMESTRKEDESEYKNTTRITKNIDEENYKLTISDVEKLNNKTTGKTSIKIDLSNVLEANSIENKISFSTDIRGDKLEATYVDRKNYVNSIDILQFKDDNSEKINDFSKEDNEYLASAISKRMVEVFEEKMKSIGIEVKMTDIVQEYNDKIEAQRKKEEDEKKAAEYNGSETKLNIDKITAFNRPYEQASKEKMKGAEYKEFLEYVLKSNKENPEEQQVKVYIKSVNRTEPVSEEEFEKYISEIDTNVENKKTYSVKIDYSVGTGLVNKLEI